MWLHPATLGQGDPDSLTHMASWKLVLAVGVLFLLAAWIILPATTDVSELQESDVGVARALEALELAQCHFHYILLVKEIHRLAKIEKVEKQAPSTFDEQLQERTQGGGIH